MLHAIIKKNTYQDSVNLMVFAGKLTSIDGVKKATVMMGTYSNKEIMKNSGFYLKDLEDSSPNDMCLVVEIKEKEEENLNRILNEASKLIDELIRGQKIEEKKEEVIIKTWDKAMKEAPLLNLALISTPGAYASIEAENALKNGLNVFIFSDNVPIEEEFKLKNLAHENGLLVMGPDCGTSIISGIPLGFANITESGSIGIVGASGTGIQEIICCIDNLGYGISHAIGTGGRDMSEEIGAITAIDSLIALDNDPKTKVIVFVSKPPSKEAQNKIISIMENLSKKVVAIFIGDKPSKDLNNVHFAYTLEEAAKISVSLSYNIKEELILNNTMLEEIPEFKFLENQRKVIALYSGGTLGAEAAMLINHSLGLNEDMLHDEGYLLKTEGFTVIDLGDDIYTRGKPHPMIDPENRIRYIKEAAKNPNTAIILLDMVLGFGAMDDPASVYAPLIKESIEMAKKEGRDLSFVISICGTRKDPQDIYSQKKKFEESGALVLLCNSEAVKTCLKILGFEITKIDKKSDIFMDIASNSTALNDVLPPVRILNEKPFIINIGLKKFYEPIKDLKKDIINFNWKPSCLGDIELNKIISKLKNNPIIDNANEEIIKRIKCSSPYLMDVVTAKTVIKELNEKVILHAGPPITFNDMTGPMKGSCIGAVLFEEWAKDPSSARELLESGQIKFIPCHHVNAVGPMGGITTGNMPVFVIENKEFGNRAYCTMNEGIGKVLRFGAFSEEVIDRLKWMKKVLGPVLSSALKNINGGLNLNVIISKAITMGDEFHQRNIAASLLFTKEIVPYILKLDIDKSKVNEVISFLLETDQFFLNIMMAASKAVMDSARQIEEGTIVTAMCRNGKHFGIRMSGTKDKWFIAPVNTPVGLFFSGYTQEDANSDIGDSSITETYGVGGMAMVAAPAVTRFVGTGGFNDALSISNEMFEICAGENSNLLVPTWNYHGACLGIDARKVVETGITPIINTGIAHKDPGIGQIGAGTVHPPIECFKQAIKEYAIKYE